MSASKLEGNTLKGFKDFDLKKGSNQGHNLALAFSIVPNSLKSGLLKQFPLGTSPMYS